MTIFRRDLIFSILLFVAFLPGIAQSPTSTLESELLAVKKLMSTDPDSAKNVLQELERFADQDMKSRIDVNELYGVYFKQTSVYDSAISYYEKNVELANQINSESLRADALLGLGSVLSDKGDLAMAQQYLYEALSFFEKEGLVNRQADAYVEIGVVLRKSKDLQGVKDLTEAKKLFKKAIEIATEPPYKALSSLAVAYENENRLDSALVIYRDLSSVFRKSDHLRGLFNAYSNMAIVYEKMGQGDSMIYYYNASVKMAKELNYTKGLAGVYHNLVRAHFILSNYDESQGYLDSAYQKAKESQSLEIFTKLKGDEAYIAQLMEDYKKAAILYEQFFILKDSLNAQKQAEIVQELNVKFETAANRQKITQLELEQKEAALALQKSKTQRYLFIMGIFVLLGFLGFSYNAYRTKKKTSEVLAIKNEQISEALAEREILLKEIHHRVKNNLQVISSLLDLQAGSLEDKAASDAVKEGQHRVQSMALIHQRLYTADDVRGVNVQEYLENLCQELFVAFGVDSEKVAFKVNASNIKLDIDTVIPLGLIVNELITNAIKYAFEDKQPGLLQVQLRKDGEKLIASVIDNGKGMSEDFIEKSNAFGWKMICSLARKLKAEIDVRSNNGTTVDLILSRFKLVP